MYLFFKTLHSACDFRALTQISFSEVLTVRVILSMNVQELEMLRRCHSTSAGNKQYTSSKCRCCRKHPDFSCILAGCGRSAKQSQRHGPGQKENSALEPDTTSVPPLQCLFHVFKKSPQMWRQRLPSHPVLKDNMYLNRATEIILTTLKSIKSD